MTHSERLWQTNRIQRVLASLIITGLLVIAVAGWSVRYGPVMGYRYYQAPTLFEVSAPQQNEAQITSTITNHELNAVTLLAYVIIRDANGTERYRSEPNMLPILTPEQSHLFVSTLPEAYHPLPEGWQVAVEVREFIAYVDDQPMREGFTLSDNQSDTAPAQINTLTISDEGDGAYQLAVIITLYNPTEHAQDLRYTLTVSQTNTTNNRFILPDLVYESGFYTLMLEANAREQFDHTLNVTLEPGNYQVGLWVQQRDENGQYAQYWQTNHPDTITYSAND